MIQTAELERQRAGDDGRAQAPAATESGSPPPPVGFPRKLAAELVGTFLLTFVDAGGAMVAAVSGGQVSPAARSAAAGLLVMALVTTLSDVSGAHINPAVTFAFALRRVFPWRRALAYGAVQIAAAVLAAGLLRGVFGNVEYCGVPTYHHGAGAAFLFEVLLTFLLVSVAVGTASHHAAVGKQAAVAAGGVVALSGLFARPVCGASMNPARALGPALVGGRVDLVPLYVSAPFVGAALAVGVAFLIHGRRKADERKAATGDGRE